MLSMLAITYIVALAEYYLIANRLELQKNEDVVKCSTSKKVAL